MTDDRVISQISYAVNAATGQPVLVVDGRPVHSEDRLYFHSDMVARLMVEAARQAGQQAAQQAADQAGRIGENAGMARGYQVGIERAEQAIVSLLKPKNAA